MSYLPNPSVLIDPMSGQVDAFGRHRVSNPNAIFDVSFSRDKRPLLFDEATTGGAAASVFNANARSVDMTLGVGAGESIVRQSFQYHRYQPGKSLLANFTGLFGSPKANVRKRIGLFDANNGVFLESADDVAFVQRSATSGAPVDTRITQANWNIDRLDGSGSPSNPSGITLSLDSTNILFIDYEWLGVGSVRFGFVIDGVPIIAHQVRNANAGLTLPYMQTGSLPARYEIENTGVPASGTTLRQICCSINSEGGFDPLGFPAAADNALAPAPTAVGAFVPVVSVRLKAADVRSQIVPRTVSFATSLANEYVVRLVLNATLGGGTAWVSLGANSIAESDVASTTIANGTIIASFVTSGQAQLEAPIASIVRLGGSIAGVADTLTLAALQRTAGVNSVFAAINFEEHY